MHANSQLACQEDDESCESCNFQESVIIKAQVAWQELKKREPIKVGLIKGVSSTHVFRKNRDRPFVPYFAATPGATRVS